MFVPEVGKQMGPGLGVSDVVLMLYHPTLHNIDNIEKWSGAEANAIVWCCGTTLSVCEELKHRWVRHAKRHDIEPFSRSPLASLSLLDLKHCNVQRLVFVLVMDYTSITKNVRAKFNILRLSSPWDSRFPEEPPVLMHSVKTSAFG